MSGALGLWVQFQIGVVGTRRPSPFTSWLVVQPCASCDSNRMNAPEGHPSTSERGRGHNDHKSVPPCLGRGCPWAGDCLDQMMPGSGRPRGPPSSTTTNLKRVLQQQVSSSRRTRRRLVQGDQPLTQRQPSMRKVEKGECEACVGKCLQSDRSIDLYSKGIEPHKSTHTRLFELRRLSEGGGFATRSDWLNSIRATDSRDDEQNLNGREPEIAENRERQNGALANAEQDCCSLLRSIAIYRIRAES